MNSETYKKIHEQHVARLKAECERMVAEGIIVEERFNAEWMEDCDAFIAHRCRDMARNGFVQVLDEAVHQMAADYFNDELHGKWKGMKFEGLGDCKDEVDESDDEESDAKTIKELAEELKDAKEKLKKSEKEAEKAKKTAEKYEIRKNPVKTEQKPTFAADPDQYDLFSLEGV